MASWWKLIADQLRAPRTGGSHARRVAVALGAENAVGNSWPEKIANFTGVASNQGSWAKRLLTIEELRAGGHGAAERLLAQYPPGMDISNARYIIPDGTGDGSSWDNGAGLTDLPSLLAELEEGGTILLRAESGDSYSVTDVIEAGWTLDAAVSIKGSKLDGTPNHAVIVGTRQSWTLPVDSEQTTDTTSWDHGVDLFNFTAMNNLELAYLDVRRVQNAFLFGENSANLNLHDLKGYNVRRFIEHSAGVDLESVTLRNIEVTGFSKQCIRFRGDSSGWLIEDIYLNSGRQDKDNFAVGIGMSETAHDIIVRRAELANCHDSFNAYFNGDGASSESGNYGIVYEDIESYGHTDGGLDNKGAYTATNVVVYGNKVNLRNWFSVQEIDGLVSSQLHHRGGTGHTAHVGLYNTEGQGPTLTLNEPSFEEDGDAYIFLYAGNDATVLVNDWIIDKNLESELQHISDGITGSVLTFDPELPVIEFGITWRTGFESGSIPDTTTAGTVIADFDASIGTGSFALAADTSGHFEVSGTTLVLASRFWAATTGSIDVRVTSDDNLSQDTNTINYSVTSVNQIRNTDFTGLTAGTPGSQPTNHNWTSTGNGLTRTISKGVGVDVDDLGIPYTEVRWVGTPSSTSNKDMAFEQNTQIAALQGQQFRLGFGFKLIAGAVTNATFQNAIQERSAGAGLTTGTQAFVPTGTYQLSTHDRTFSNASAAFLLPICRMLHTSGQAIDVTFRIYAPRVTRLS